MSSAGSLPPLSCLGSSIGFGATKNDRARIEPAINSGLLFRDIFLPVAEPIVQFLDKPRRRFRNRRAWGKDRRHPGRVQRLEILGRNDAAHDNHDITSTPTQT